MNPNVSPQQFHPNINAYRDGGMGGVGEDYWPSDIHPKYLWPSEDVQ